MLFLLRWSCGLGDSGCLCRRDRRLYTNGGGHRRRSCHNSGRLLYKSAAVKLRTVLAVTVFSAFERGNVIGDEFLYVSAVMDRIIEVVRNACGVFAVQIALCREVRECGEHTVFVIGFCLMGEQCNVNEAACKNSSHKDYIGKSNRVQGSLSALLFQLFSLDRYIYGCVFAVRSLYGYNRLGTRSLIVYIFGLVFFSVL